MAIRTVALAAKAAHLPLEHVLEAVVVTDSSGLSAVIAIARGAIEPEPPNELGVGSGAAIANRTSTPAATSA